MRLVIVALAISAASVVGLRSPPKADVDLSLPPEKRWDAAVAALAAAGVDWSSFQRIFSAHNSTLMDNISPEQYTTMYQNIEKYTFPGFALELQGLSTAISSTFGNYVSPEYLAAWTWFHELGHSELAHDSVRKQKACTAVVAFSAEGRPVHGRNMDQSPAHVRDLTMQLRFMDGDRLLFHGVDWYWFAGGVMTSMMPGRWAVQENWRIATINSSAVFDAPPSVVPQLLAFRMLMTAGADSYDEAVMKLSTMEFAAPMYVIVSGNSSSQGTIIVRGATTSAEYGLTTRGGCRYCANYGIVETNAEPEALSDTRRDTAIRSLNSVDQAVATTPTGMLAIMNVNPVTNGATAYTAVMVPATGEIYAFIRTYGSA